MDLLTILVLSVALCFDSFAVSLSCGLGCCQWSWLKGLRFAFVLGFLQGAMIFIGWSLAVEVHTYISAWDHWIAFSLLAFLGGKMIYGSLKSKDDQSSSEGLTFGKSVILGIATSIDAVIAGVSVAFVSISILESSQIINMLLVFAIVGFVTFLASVIGLLLGRGCRSGFGSKLGSRAELFGGVVLVLIGLKVLFEHLG